MKDKVYEQLSAMFDNELDEQEHELLLHRLKQDEEMQQAFARYQIMGDAVQPGGKRRAFVIVAG